MQGQFRTKRTEVALNKKERRQARDKALESEKGGPKIYFSSAEDGLWNVSGEDNLTPPSPTPNRSAVSPEQLSGFKRQAIQLDLAGRKAPKSSFNFKTFLDEVRMAISQRLEKS